MHIFKTPFLFLRVSYPNATMISWIAPIIMSSSTMIVVYLLPGSINIGGADGFLERVITIMTISGGFFVTSLTVILTNESAVINGKFIGEGKPEIISEGEFLTRKRFLSLLFGYISFISFCIVGIISFSLVVSSSFRIILNDITFEILEYVSGFILLTFLFQIFLFSMVGLHYLADRLHRADGRSHFSKEIPEDPVSRDGT